MLGYDVAPERACELRGFAASAAVEQRSVALPSRSYVRDICRGVTAAAWLSVTR